MILFIGIGTLVAGIFAFAAYPFLYFRKRDKKWDASNHSLEAWYN